MTSYNPDVVVDCHVRASATGNSVEEIVRTLREYRTEGVIDDLTVERWPAEIRLNEDTEGNPIRDRFERFQEWADEDGVSLEPMFTRRERTCRMTDDTWTALVLPVLCLAVRVDGELVSVAPHGTGRETYTVTDAMADVESFAGVPSSAEVSDVPSDHPVRSTLESDSREERPEGEGVPEH